MSRIPRFQEHLKTGFTAAATSAARYRAYAARAERDGMPHLASHWLALATEKDALAIVQLEAADQVRGEAADIVNAISGERYESDVLYPKMIRDAGEPKTVEVFEQVVERQREHLARLEELRRQAQASTGDVEAPAGAVLETA